MLKHYEPRTTCELLRHRSILFVGDSTMVQMFGAFVMLLGGEFGRQHLGKDVTASACNDTVRLNYVRNDLALWLEHGDTSGSQVRRCNSQTLSGTVFSRRAVDADVLVLGVGQHTAPSFFSRGSPLAARLRNVAGEAERAASAFFFHNFNHTLSTVLARRAAAFGASAASTIVLGASIPVPGCSRFTAPASAAAAHAVYARPDVRNLTNYYDHWRLSFELNAVARALVTSAGAWMLDVAEPSLQRPDAARGFDDTNTTEDCLHYCPPGPVDEFARMLSQLLHEGNVFAPAGQPASRPRRSRMFAVNYSEWSTIYGIYDVRYESLPSREMQKRWDVEPALMERSWWPFNACGLQQSRVTDYMKKGL